MKTTPLGVRVSPALKDALDRAARDDVRSTASLVAKILTAWVRDHGFLENEEQSLVVRRPGRPRVEQTREDALKVAGPILPWIEQVIGDRTEIRIRDILATAKHGATVSPKLISTALHGLGWTEDQGDAAADASDRVWRH